MKTLMIKDLSANVELDREAMAAVAGGSYYFPLPYFGAPSRSYSRTDIDVKEVIANQNLAQVMNVNVATGINTAFASDLESNVDSYQSGSNNINIS